VHFEWLLDTVHGADYFRRWHRLKDKSGGLMVHKSGHHFDLVSPGFSLSFSSIEQGARRDKGFGLDPSVPGVAAGRAS
jgi:predicted dehydrogenase